MTHEGTLMIMVYISNTSKTTQLYKMKAVPGALVSMWAHHTEHTIGIASYALHHMRCIIRVASYI